MIDGRLVLALDGSTNVCSTALLRVVDDSGSRSEHEVLAARTDANGQGQARVLLRLVDEMLEQIGSAPGNLGSIVVGVGPGTFTGVRIAVATARGLALGLSVPVYGVGTLSALAGCFASSGPGETTAERPAIVPVVDARRQQVFYAVYRPAKGVAVGGLRWMRSSSIGVCDKDALGEVLEAHGLTRVAVVGEERGLIGELPDDAAFVERVVDAGYLVTCGRWLDEEDERGVGSGVGEHGGESIRPGAPELVRPIYVRAPDADLHITKMKDPWADGRDRA